MDRAPRLSLRLDDKLAEDLNWLKIETGRSKNDLILEAVYDLVLKYKAKAKGEVK